MKQFQNNKQPANLRLFVYLFFIENYIAPRSTLIIFQMNGDANFVFYSLIDNIIVIIFCNFFSCCPLNIF